LLQLSLIVALQTLGQADASGNVSLLVTFSADDEGKLLLLRFFARANLQTSSPSVDRNITIDTKPEVPTGLVAEALDTRVRLRWNRSVLEALDI